VLLCARGGGKERIVAAPEALVGVAGGALVGGKVSTQGRRGRTLARCANPAAAWELSVCIIERRSLTHHTFTRPFNTRISSTIGSMSQPVVQTIHRDPALLYVNASLRGDGMASLTSMQLVDIAPHHSGHGAFSCRCFKYVCLIAFPGPDGHPPPLRHDAPPNDAQEARSPQDPPTAFSRSRR
jgi:hypothetical protein